MDPHFELFAICEKCGKLIYDANDWWKVAGKNLCSEHGLDEVRAQTKNPDARPGFML